MKKMFKVLMIGLSLAIVTIAPKLANACSGTYYACGSTSIVQMMEDAGNNCPSGSSFTIEHCDGGSFPVNVQ
jgi:hypothetical protein